MKSIVMYEQIRSDLKQKIEDGTYQPGDRVPSEAELAAEYGVSRITSRKALTLLSESGDIIRLPGRGSFVKVPEPRKETKRPAVPEDSRFIGVVLDSLGEGFGCTMLKGMEDACRRMGYDMIFKCSMGDIELENASIRSCVEDGAQGLILMCVQGENYNDKVLKLLLDGYPIVLVDRHMKGISVPCVQTDNYAAATELTEHLLRRGHRGICFISHAFHTTSTINDRYRGFADAVMKYKGIDASFEWIQDQGSVDGDGLRYRAGIEEAVLRNRDKTAFFATESKIAVHLRALFDRMKISAEIASFDKTWDMDMEETDLLQVVQDEIRIGEKAVETLQEVIQGKPVENHIYIPYRISPLQERQK